MEIRKNSIVRITLNGQTEVGDYFRVSKCEGERVYCHQLIEGRKDGITHILRRNKLKPVFFTGVSTKDAIIEQIRATIPTAIKVPNSEKWNKILQTRQQRDVLVHLFNDDHHVYIKFISGVRQDNDIILFGLQIVS